MYIWLKFKSEWVFCKNRNLIMAWHNNFNTFKNFVTGHVLYFAKHKNTKLSSFCRSYVLFALFFDLKMYVFDLSFAIFLFQFHEILKIQLLRDIFDTFKIFETGCVLNFVKLQKTKFSTFCRPYLSYYPLSRKIWCQMLDVF